MRKSVLIADLFCGAGGFTTGAQRAAESLGLRVDGVAVNHWPVAVDTHSKNHPGMRHLCQDLSTVRPIEAVPEGKLDLLMASPTCTYFSKARGGKTVTDQQRADAWHIVTWLTELRVKRLIVENVPEFRDWGPVNVQTGKPIKSRKGEYFKAWISTLKNLGFSKIEWKVLNAADMGAFTSRERLFILARSDGKPIQWPERTHSKKGIPDLFGQGGKKWQGARHIIDWSLEGRSIFDRKKPLSLKTLKRIYAGAVKYGWSEGYLVLLRNHMNAVSLNSPVPTLTAGGTHVGLVQMTGGSGKDATAALGAYMDGLGNGQAMEPFIANVAHGDDGSALPSARSKSLDEPIGTLHAGGNAFALVSPERSLDQSPFVLSQASGGVARTTAEPIPSLCTGGAHALLIPTGGSEQALIAPYYGSGSGATCKGVNEPLDTVTTRDRFGFVMPVTHHGDGDRTRSLDQPVPTVTGANRGELAFITPAFGEREGQAPRTHSLDCPMPTLCAQGTINLVQAVRTDAGDGTATVVNMKGQSTATSVNSPTPTQTAHAGHLYLAEPLVLNLKKGAATQNGSVPLPTQTASADHIALASVTPNGLDIRFRMLQPEELAKAMGLSTEEIRYVLTGTKTQKIKQIGNAVEAKNAQALCETMLST